MRVQAVKTILALAALLALAACSTTPPEGTGGDTGTTVALAGVVEGTDASPTLLGKELDLSEATVTVNGDEAEASVRPGMVIYGQGVDQGSSIAVQSVDVQIEVKGPIDRVNVADSQLVVLGQTVTVNALTRIYEENPDGSYASLVMADLMAGDYVEVSGTREDDGSILATRIERKPVRADDPDYDRIEVKGYAANLDEAVMTFELGGYTVDYGGAIVEGEPAEGAFVEVKGTLDVASLTISAEKVEFKNEDRYMDFSGEKAEVYGPVVRLDEAAMTFEVAGFTVDYSNATVEGTLQEGAYVEVEGSLDVNNPARIYATKVEVKYATGGDGSTYGEVRGFVEAIDPAQMLITVGGQTLWADENTIVKQDDPDGPLAFDQIRVGDWAEVKYDSTRTDAEGHAYAAKIEVKAMDDGDSGDDGYFKMEGFARNVDAAAMTFELNGFTVDYSNATVEGTLQEGAYVEVEGSIDSNDPALVHATKVEVKDQGDGDCACDGEVKGTVESVDLVAMQLTVGGMTFWVDASTEIKHSDTDQPMTFDQIRVGDWAEVKYDSTRTDAEGHAYAAKIEVKAMDDGDSGDDGYFKMEGFARNVDAAAMTFELNGFTVVVDENTAYKIHGEDATSEAFWSQISEGDKVEVEGTEGTDATFLAHEIDLES